MAKEGVSHLLGANGVINRQSWPNNLCLETKWKLLFPPGHILDHTYCWLEYQVEVSGRVLGPAWHAFRPRQTTPAARASGGGRGSTPAPPAKPLVGRLRGGSEPHLEGQAGGLGGDHHGGRSGQDIPDCHRQLQEQL